MALRKHLSKFNALRNCMAQTPALAANTGRKQATVAMERVRAMQAAQSELGRTEALHRGSNQITQQVVHAGRSFGWVECGA
jgi:hypothetical protein